MKIIILTTETKHHRYFINKLEKELPGCIECILFENPYYAVQRTYETGPFFDTEKQQYEDLFFTDMQYEYSRSIKSKSYTVPNINTKQVAALIKTHNLDLAITFGTGLIKPFIFNIPKFGTINIHRGCAANYRGLDSHLWAMYNKEFNKLDITVHHVDETLDTGDVLSIQNMGLHNIDHIYNMRYESTVIATSMVIDILKQYPNVKRTKQIIKGEYYTAMSLHDKYIALKNFLQYKYE
jgi:methionyl-tRNA formyltransferase